MDFRKQWTNTSRWHCSPNHHWLETSHWTSSNMDSVPLYSSSRLWDLDFQILPVNFAFNMLWYSTPWTAPPPPPLSVMTLCDLLSLWRCQWLSSGPLPSQQCSPLLCFQRTRDTHNLYCMDGHFLNLKSCKYSNILRYWIFTFMSCKL